MFFWGRLIQKSTIVQIKFAVKIFHVPRLRLAHEPFSQGAKMLFSQDLDSLHFLWEHKFNLFPFFHSPSKAVHVDCIVEVLMQSGFLGRNIDGSFFIDG